MKRNSKVGIGDHAKFKHMEPQTGLEDTLELERIDANAELA